MKILSASKKLSFISWVILLIANIKSKIWSKQC